MTQIEKFVALYKEFGIECKVNKDDDGKFCIVFVQENEMYDPRDDVGLTVSGKFGGYSSFYSDIFFDKDGNFIKQSFWE